MRDSTFFCTLVEKYIFYGEKLKMNILVVASIIRSLTLTLKLELNAFTLWQKTFDL